MADPINILATIIPVAGAISAAGFAFWQNTKNTRINAETQKQIAQQNAAIENQKIAGEAYDRAKSTYERIMERMQSEIDRVSHQIDRVQAQADKVSEQFAHEVEVSTSLRIQLRQQNIELEALREQVKSMQKVLDRYRLDNDTKS